MENLFNYLDFTDTEAAKTYAAHKIWNRKGSKCVTSFIKFATLEMVKKIQIAEFKAIKKETENKEATTSVKLVEGIEVEEMTIWESRTMEGYKIRRVISRHNGEIDYSDNVERGKGDWDREAISREEFIRTLSKADIKRVVEFENSCAAEQTAQAHITTEEAN